LLDRKFLFLLIGSVILYVIATMIYHSINKEIGQAMSYISGVGGLLALVVALVARDSKKRQSASDLNNSKGEVK
jgi:hypothetical protein